MYESDRRGLYGGEHAVTPKRPTYAALRKQRDVLARALFEVRIRLKHLARWDGKGCAYAYQEVEKILKELSCE